MVVHSTVVRRTLLGVVAVLLFAAVALVLWVGDPPERGRTQAAGERPEPATERSLADSTAEGLAAAGPGSGDPVQATGEAEAAELDDEARRAVPREPGAGERRARLRCQPARVFDQLFVGRGGVLPLDSPAALEAAVLELGSAGFVRSVPLASLDPVFVTDLAPGPLRVLFRSVDGRRVEFEGLWILPGETLDLGEVEAPKDIVFDLQVIGRTGMPVPGARVGALADRPGGAWRALGLDSAIPLGVTNELGIARFRMNPGPWRLRIVAEGQTSSGLQGASLIPLSSQGFIEYTPDQEVHGLQVQLEAGSLVHGELIDPDDLGTGNRPIASFNLAAPGPDPQQALAAGFPPRALAGVGRWSTTPEGRLSVTGLAQGDAVRMRALIGTDLTRPDAFAPETLARAGDLQAEVVQYASAGLDFEVRESGSNRAVGRFTATLEGVWPAGPRHQSSPTVRWRDMRPFEFALNPVFADLPESPELRLFIEAEGYDSSLTEGIRLRTGETTEPRQIALHALPPVYLKVLAAETGQPLEGARCEFVAVLPEQAVGRSHSSAASDSQGQARLSVLANNAADLLVRCKGYAPFRSRAPAPNLAESPFEVRLVRGGTLRVQVLDLERQPVRAEVLRRRTVVETGHALSEAVERQLTDAKGWAEFTELAAGSSLVAARALPRSDLDLPLPLELLTWAGAGVPPGGLGQVELAALPVFTTSLTLKWRGSVLPHALVRVEPGADGFTRPVQDSRSLMTGPVQRSDARGLCVLAGLPAGTYSLRIEHPLISGFARSLLQVGAGSPTRTLELDRTWIHGGVYDSNGKGRRARVVVWALGPTFYDGLEVVAGDSLRDLVPEPVLFASQSFNDANFALNAPPGIELVVTATERRRSGDYFLNSLGEGEDSEPIRITIQDDLELQVVPALEPAVWREMELGLVALNLDHPWGRGVIATPLERGRLELGKLPTGRWRMCLVELAAGHLVLARGAWSEYDLGSRRERVRLPW